ncbi:MAG: hypothetical protein ACTSUD_00380 [Alphaproteobacteria bacterium]
MDAMPDDVKILEPEVSRKRVRADRHALLFRVLRSPLGAAIARPWFHALASRILIRWFFPLSRLWAAASVAEGSIERFAEAVPMPAIGQRQRRRIARMLDKTEAARRRAGEARQAWEAAFFGAEALPTGALVKLERRRRGASHAYMMCRFGFRFLRRRGVPAANWAIPDAAAVEAAYGDFARQPERAYAAPDPLPKVEASGVIPASIGRKYWLRFPSPSARVGGMAYATVHEPDGDAPAPTLVFGHGVGVENDLWRETVDNILLLVRGGIRVIEVTAPGHGLRAQRGRYGGEIFFATAPLGVLDLFTAEVPEMAVLIDWARRHGSARVGLGGVSLGALVAQLALTHAGHWPAGCRPDAALLVTHAGTIEQTGAGGTLTRGLGLPQAMEAAGWTDEGFARWRALTDPQGEPALAASKIVSVLASRDDVTPFASGHELVRKWGIPSQNLFILRQGHFSLPLALLRDGRAFDRFAQILREG